MRRIASRIALLVILTLLAQSSPLFAQQHPLESRATISLQHATPGSIYDTVDVMTPAQFVDPPAFTRHSLKKFAIGTGIFAVVATIFVRIVGPMID